MSEYMILSLLGCKILIKIHTRVTKCLLIRREDCFSLLALGSWQSLALMLTHTLIRASEHCFVTPMNFRQFPGDSHH